MDGFERRKEQSKEDIRRAAEELFSRFGADKVSINDIARKAGVSQATIYNNFGSKEDLVHDYRQGAVATVASSFREILVWKKSWVEKLQRRLAVLHRYRRPVQNRHREPRSETVCRFHRRGNRKLIPGVYHGGEKRGQPAHRPRRRGDYSLF